MVGRGTEREWGGARGGGGGRGADTLIQKQWEREDLKWLNITQART